MASSKPTIVLVHGAWHGPRNYQSLIERLEAAGYDVIAPSLPSVSENPVTKNLDEDIAAVRSAIEPAADEGKDVVVVAHSWGGVVGGSAAEGLGKDQRQKDGKKGGIIRLVYICAFAAPEGVSLFQATGGPDPWITFDGNASRPTRMGEIFYNDCPPDVVEEQSKSLRPHSRAAFETPAPYAGWKHLPSTYLVCEQDMGIPVHAQEAMIAQPGANFTVERCKASHSPFLSMPDFTAQFVRRACGEQI